MSDTIDEYGSGQNNGSGYGHQIKRKPAPITYSAQAPAAPAYTAIETKHDQHQQSLPPGRYKPVPLSLPFLLFFCTCALSIFVVLEWAVDATGGVIQKQAASALIPRFAVPDADPDIWNVILEKSVLHGVNAHLFERQAVSPTETTPGNGLIEGTSTSISVITGAPAPTGFTDFDGNGLIPDSSSDDGPTPTTSVGFVEPTSFTDFGDDPPEVDSSPVQDLTPPTTAPSPSGFTDFGNTGVESSSSSSTVITVGEPAPTDFTNFDGTDDSSSSSENQAGTPTVFTGGPDPTGFTNFDGTEVSSVTKTSSTSYTIYISPAPTSYTNFGDNSTTTTTNPKTSTSKRFSKTAYFFGAYFPTIVAVLFGALWDIIHANIVEMEPFFRLAAPMGATFLESLCCEYRTSSLPLIFLHSLGRRHWMVVASCVVSVLIKICTPLASGTLYIATTGECSSTGDGRKCHPFLAIQPVFVRIVEGIVLVIALMTCIIIWKLWSRPSGLYGEATSIAGVAVLCRDPKLADDLRKDYGALKERNHSVLTDIRYKLGRRDVYGDYGIISLDGNDRSMQEDRGVGNPHAAKVKPASQPIVLRWPALLIFGFLLAGLLTMILYYKFSGSELTGFERFMDSQGFGVRMMFTAIGVVIKLYWDILDTEMRAIEPYHLLSVGKAQPQQTLFVKTKSHAIIALFDSMTSRHFYVSFISFTSLLAEILVVTIGGIPFSSAQSYKAYLISTYLSTAVLCIMIISVVALLFRPRLKVGKPETLAETMLLVSRSRMLDGFQGLGECRTTNRNKRIVGIGGVYGFGEKVGTDGVLALMVDEEERRGTVQFT